ncbi:MAG: hypothetical protein RJA63_3134, partial [Pseudomonadota bacterium]
MNPIPVLVLEDEPQIRGMLCQCLAGEGLLPHGAGSLVEARETLRAEACQLALIDLGLPDGSGQTFIRELRAWSTMPVLVLSARNQERDKIEALDTGADDYLTKPFQRGELLARVRALLRRAGSSGAQP